MVFVGSGYGEPGAHHHQEFRRLFLLGVDWSGGKTLCHRYIAIHLSTYQSLQLIAQNIQALAEVASCRGCLVNRARVNALGRRLLCKTMSA